MSFCCDDLKIVRILCLFNILIQSDLLFWHMGEWIGFFRFGYVSETIVLFACSLIFWLCLFYRVRFSVRLVLSSWVLSRCSLLEIVKDLCTSELIADCFCARWWCDSACRYLSVCVSFLYTWWLGTVVFLETRISRKGSFSFFSIMKWIFGYWLLRKIRNLRSSALSYLHIMNVSTVYNGIKLLVFWVFFWDFFFQNAPWRCWRLQKK